MIVKAAAGAGLFILTIIAGLVLARLGKPYNPVVFTIHKLLGLAFVVVTFMAVYDYTKQFGIKNYIVILSALMFISATVAFATGVFLTIGKYSGQLLQIIHNISAVICFVLTAFLFYRIISK